MAEKDMAQKIKELRLANDLTLEQVADIVGVGKSTVRKWETGMIANMRRDKIAALAQALHTTPEYLMGWSTTMEVSNLFKIETKNSGYLEISPVGNRSLPMKKRNCMLWPGPILKRISA